jgi:hypothetical protein
MLKRHDPASTNRFVKKYNKATRQEASRGLKALFDYPPAVAELTGRGEKKTSPASIAT